jgi:hypothetical protein
MTNPESQPPRDPSRPATSPEPSQPAEPLQYFGVKDWAKYQHYGERRPDWIKLHARLLDSFNFECLADSAKLHVILIWLLASRCNNSIPLNSKYVQRRIGTETEPDLHDLIARGYLEIVTKDSNGLQGQNGETLAGCKRNASLDLRIRKENINTKGGKVILFLNNAGVENSWGLFPCADGSMFDLSRQSVVDLAARYPQINMAETLNDIQNWLKDNEQKRKAPSAMAGFITSWLRRDAVRLTTKAGKASAGKRKQTAIDSFGGAQ